MKRFSPVLLTVALAALLLGATALALAGDPPVADVFVRATDPDANFDGTRLSVSGSTVECNPTDVSYLRWELPSLPLDGHVASAALTLTTYYVANTESAYLSLYATGDGWEEDTLTFARAPAAGALLGTAPAPTSAGQLLVFDGITLTDHLEGEMAGDGTASFLLRLDRGCAAGVTLALFEDRERADGPRLDVAIETELADFADLRLSKRGPATALAGERLTYTLAYSNAGTLPATGVVITDALPAELLSPAVTASGVVTPRAGSRYVWDVADLAPGEGGTITLTATVSPTFAGVLTNTASITTTSPETATEDNHGVPVVTTVETVNLTLSKAGPATARPGAWVTYTLAYANAGTGMASGVVITDALPSALISSTVTFTGASRIPGSWLTWDVGELAPGGGGTITVTAALTPSFTGPMTNTAVIAGRAPEPDHLDNRARWATLVEPYYLYLPLVIR